MNLNIDDINIEKLRKDLIDYFTSAMFIASPLALEELTKVENVDNKKLIEIALKNKFDIKKYIKHKKI